MMTESKLPVTVLLAAALLLTGGLYLPARATDMLPIRYVRTTGLFHYLSREDIKSALKPLVATNFISADMQAIRRAVEALPWVASATVERVWPDAVDIDVVERRPYARWGDGALLTEQGVLFAPKNAASFTQLPKLTGPEGRHPKVLEIGKGIQTELEDQSLDLAEFDINSREAWTITLTSGTVIELGRSEQLKKLRRFLKTLPALGRERFGAVAGVDLRYPNGFAVAWKPDAACCDWEQKEPLPLGAKPEKNIKSNNNGKKNRA